MNVLALRQDVIKCGTFHKIYQHSRWNDHYEDLTEGFTEGEGRGKNRSSTVETPISVGKCVSDEENVILKYSAVAHNTHEKCHQRDLLPQVWEQMCATTY